MTAPRLYDIHETSKLVGLSESWLYRHAGKTIPVTRPGGTNKLFWTEEQHKEIISMPRRSPQRTKPAKDAERASKRRETAESKPPPMPQPSGVRIPQARPERSRLYRSAGAS